MEGSGNVFKELGHRLKKPWCISFTLYFFVVVMFFGSAGLWIPAFHSKPLDSEDIIVNLITYSCALIAPAIIGIILSVIKSRYKLSLTIICVVILFFVGFLASKQTWWTAILCVVLSLLSWIIANYDNETLKDDYYKTDLDINIKEGAKAASKDWDKENG